MSTVFVKSKDEYFRKIDPIGQYIEQSARYLSVMTGDSYEKCEAFLREKFKNKEFKDLKNPNVVYFEREDNGDKFKKDIPLSNYIYTVIKNDEILVPSFTVYKNPKIKPSLITKFVDINTKIRSIAKKEAFKARAAKNEILYIFKNNEQNNRKLGNNSLSGCFVATGSFINNPSAHSTLTSTTRTGTSLANASNERLLAGNRHYFSPDVVMNNITSIIHETDYEAMLKGMNCPKLKNPIRFPTVDETFECLKYSSDLYWRDPFHSQKIYNYILKLTPEQRAAVVYTGDFYHIRKLNDETMREFIGALCKKVEAEVQDPISIIKSLDEQVIILAHMICSNEVKGYGKDYEKMLKAGGILNKLAPTALNIQTTINDYKDFIQGFFLTSNIPPTISHIRDMVRRVVVISDTDSTCFSTGEWVEWYRGDIIFDDLSLAVCGVMTYLATQTFMHTMALYSANINVEKEKLHVLAYKSEWTWTIVAPMNVAKHYFARAVVQEGDVFEHPELELKGVHLKNSNTPQFIVKDSTALINEIMDTVTSNKKVSLTKCIKRVADMERYVSASLIKGELEFYRQVKIKDSEAYSKGGEESPYQHYLLWNEVFQPKYGNIEKPPYGVAKIPTTLSNPTAIKKWLAEIEDRDFAEKMGSWLIKKNKTSFNTFYISANHLKGFGMPAEIKNAIDTKRIILDLLNVYYIILESIGFYKKVGFTLTELGY